MKIWKWLDVSDMAKAARAKVIRGYMEQANIRRAVCFSCGNATRKLQEAGVELLAIAPGGDMLPGRWFTQSEIADKFSGYFDATSGHLNLTLMTEIALNLRKQMALQDGGLYDVPTGSGETIVCLKMAFPTCEFRAVYNNLNPATSYEPKAPLNTFVATFFETKTIEQICKN
jgi:hypothetical protein